MALTATKWSAGLYLSLQDKGRVGDANPFLVTFKKGTCLCSQKQKCRTHSPSANHNKQTVKVTYLFPRLTHLPPSPVGPSEPGSPKSGKKSQERSSRAQAALPPLPVGFAAATCAPQMAWSYLAHFLVAVPISE